MTIADKVRQHIPKVEPESIKQWARDVCELLASEGIETTPKYVENVYFRSRETLEFESEGKPPYNVVDNHYVWKAEKGNIRISIEQADQLFWQYSKYGLNFSSTEIRTSHNLQPWQWNTIKFRLSLYKDSHIFSPYTWENTPESEREQLVQDKINTKFDNVNDALSRQHRKELEKRYKQEVQKGAKSKFFAQELKAELLDVLPRVKAVKLSKAPDPIQGKDIVAAIADLHIGAEVKGLRITRDFDNEILRGYLSKVAQYVNAQNAQRVTLVKLGDIIESLTGLMHPNTWKSMQGGMYGAKVVIAAYEILMEFIGQINNLERICGVGGNHDRIGKKEIEANGEIAELIFYMLKQSLPDIEVVYDHSIVVKELYGINYLFCHDDKAFTQKNKVGELLFHYGDKNLFNMVVGGHLHSRITQLDGVRSRKINIPSLFTGNRYSEDLGYSSTAGFCIFESIDGLPKVTDYTF